MAKFLSLISRRHFVAVCNVLVISGTILQSWYMVNHRNFGLREIISRLEDLYNRKQDCLLILSRTGEEAVKLYATHEIEYFVVEQNAPLRPSLLSFQERTKNKQRLWVLEYPRKTPLMHTSMWKKQLKPKKFYEYRIHKTALLGYHLATNIVTTNAKRLDEATEKITRQSVCSSYWHRDSCQQNREQHTPPLAFSLPVGKTG